MKRRALLVCDYFAPQSAVGVHRSLALVEHLACRGWDITVLAARPRPGDAVDERLMDRVPKGVRIVQVLNYDLPMLASRLLRPGRHAAAPKPAAPSMAVPTDTAPPLVSKRGLRRVIDWLSLWMHVPDTRGAWRSFASATGMVECLRARPGVIFSSAPMWSSHVVASRLARWFHVPHVADFRDPWVGSPWRDIPYAAHRLMDRSLERRVMARARYITCAWEGITRLLHSRYPAKAQRIATIYNGFPSAAFQQACDTNTRSDRCVLLHVGTFYGHRSPMPLIEGLAQLRREGVSLDKLRVLLAGNPNFNNVPLVEFIKHHQLTGVVEVIPPLPHQQSLQLLASADVAMLFGQSGSQELASIPAKTFEYIGAGKCVLAVGAGVEALGVLRDGGCGVFAANDAAQVADAIRQILKTWSSGKLADMCEPSRRERFTQAKMAQRLEAVLLAAMLREPAAIADVLSLFAQPHRPETGSIVMPMKLQSPTFMAEGSGCP